VNIFISVRVSRFEKIVSSILFDIRSESRIWVDSAVRCEILNIWCI